MKKKKSCNMHCTKIKNISVTIDNLNILEDVNMHVHCGELTTIIGNNGAGKSTLLKAILGEVKHTGEIVFENIKNKRMENIKIGYVPQKLHIEKSYPISVYDLVCSYVYNAPIMFFKKAKLYKEIKRNLKFFEADKLIDKRVGDLSGGELQRVLLTIATYDNPNLLILDEPVSGIDHNGMNLFYKNIEILKKEYDMSIILVSHDLEYVYEYSDKVVLLDKKVIKEGTPKEVFESEEFKEHFGSYKKEVK